MKLIKLKRLSPLALLVAPVVGEMVINKEGLPTPWPVAIVGSLITLVTVISLVPSLIISEEERTQVVETSAEIEILPKYSAKWWWTNVKWVLIKPKELGAKFLKYRLVTKLLMIYSFFNCLVPLFGSFNSLRVNGLKGFQYPELAFLTALPFFIIYPESSDPSPEITSTRDVIFFFLKDSFITLLIFPFLWQIVGLGIYASLKNFSASTQFITTCTQMPTTSWQTITHCIPTTDNLYQCHLGSKNAWIIGLLVRTLIFVSASVLSDSIDKIKVFFTRQQRTQSDRNLTFFSSFNPERVLGREVSLTIKFFISLTTIFYVISIGLIQWKGLNITGLEGICNINSELLNSKTGYIVEWFQQNWTALKQIALI